MRKSEFIDQLKEALELEDMELTAGTSLRDLEEFDSLAAMYLIAMVDESFGKELSADEIRSITTVSSLIDIIGEENFAEE